MSKFNSPKPTIKTTNKSNYPAYAMTAKSKLVTQVLTSFFNEKKFYGDNSADIQETVKTVIKTDPEFVSNLAVFARREFNMRSISHVLTAYLAHEVEGKPFVRHTIKGVSLRGDDITEIMACYLNLFGKPIPNSMKKGIADVLQGFDEYTLAKYKGDSKSVKMRDLLCLCRPKPKDKMQEDLWKRCLEGKLAIPETWETQLSARGNKKEVWEDLIASGKVGYMALLRNLRNILKADPDNLDLVYQRLRDPNWVKKSKQLPFRFLSAYQTLRSENLGTSKTYDVLEDAMDASINNLPKIPGKTVIAVDVSGSMSHPISRDSDIRCCDIAMLLGMIANRICEDAVVFTFENHLGRIPMSSRGGILSEVLHNRVCGGGTNMGLPFQAMINQRIKADRIIILSDNECNSSGYWGSSRPVQSLADEYRRLTGHDIWVHAVDLQGYGTQQFHGAKTNIIAGWSEKIFDFILLAEEGEGNLEKRIKAYIW